MLRKTVYFKLSRLDGALVVDLADEGCRLSVPKYSISQEVVHDPSVSGLSNVFHHQSHYIPGLNRQEPWRECY